MISGGLFFFFAGAFVLSVQGVAAGQTLLFFPCRITTERRCAKKIKQGLHAETDKAKRGWREGRVFPSLTFFRFVLI